jgi:hypothetical protein
VVKSEAEKRRERLAEALRANLKRRKAHKGGDAATRARSGPELPPGIPGDEARSRPKPLE